jgi:hypothetical protein
LKPGCRFSLPTPGSSERFENRPGWCCSSSAAVVE